MMSPFFILLPNGTAYQQDSLPGFVIFNYKGTADSLKTLRGRGSYDSSLRRPRFTWKAQVTNQTASPLIESYVARKDAK